MHAQQTGPMPHLRREPSGTLSLRRRIRSVLFDIPPDSWTASEAAQVLRVFEQIRHDRRRLGNVTYLRGRQR